MFDEPLTVIDPHLKWELRSKLKELHHRTRRTMIYVTHDQTEALTFAEQVVVMKDGLIVQIGTPVELFERPRHTFVGHFIGSPGMNVLPCELKSGKAFIGEHPVKTVEAKEAGKAFRARGQAGIRELYRQGILVNAMKVRMLDVSASSRRSMRVIPSGWWFQKVRRSRFGGTCPFRSSPHASL